MKKVMTMFNQLALWNFNFSSFYQRWSRKEPQENWRNDFDDFKKLSGDVFLL